MNPIYRRRLKDAVRTRQVANVLYAKPGRGLVTRYVHGLELSHNKAGRGVLWATDSVHPNRLHSFRTDRIRSVTISDRARTFTKDASISKSLVHEGRATAPKVIPRPLGRPAVRPAAPAPVPYRPRPVFTLEVLWHWARTRAAKGRWR